MNIRTVFLTVFSFLLLSTIYMMTPIGAEAKQYFVAPNGSDEQDGSFKTPFRTIQHAVERSSANDEIIVRQGTYYELVNIYDFDGPLTIKPYAQERVIVDGSKRDIASSKRAAFSIRDSRHITIKGFHIQHITSDDRSFYPAGILIRGESKHITIENNTIHHIANTHARGNAHGIIVYGNAPNAIEHVTIRNNELHHLTVGRSESLTVSGNVRHFTIENNYLHDNNNIGIDIAGHYGACSDAGCIDVARDGKIKGNIVTHHSSATNRGYEGSASAPGIYIDGGANITVEYNYVAYNNYGISVASENEKKRAQNIMIRHNLITHNDKAGLVLGGSSIDNGGTQAVHVIQNTFLQNDRLREGYFEVTIQQHNAMTLFRRNTYYNYTPQYINNQSETASSISFEEEQHFMLQLILLPFKWLYNY